MKTPREVLVGQHRSAESRLDAIRHQAVASVVRASDPQPDRGLLDALRRFVAEYRWHFVGMTAIWAMIGLMSLKVGQPSGSVAAIPREKIPSPQTILVSLRENRRELRELIQPVEARDARPNRLFLFRLRDERSGETLPA